MAQPASSVDLAILVLASLALATSPTKMAALFFTRFVVNLWIASLRRFAILACIALTRFFFRALCAAASCGSLARNEKRFAWLVFLRYGC